MQLTQGTPMEHLVLLTRGGLCCRAIQDFFYTSLLLSRPSDTANLLYTETDLDKIRRQRNTPQMKEQDKITEKELNEMKYFS